MVKKIQEKTMSVIDELKKLDEQRAALIAKAKTEALKKVESGIAELSALGFSYRLAEDGEEVAAPVRKKAASGITRQRDPNKPCSVCGEIGHDARRHRSENIAKKNTGK